MKIVNEKKSLQFIELFEIYQLTINQAQSCAQLSQLVLGLCWITD